MPHFALLVHICSLNYISPKLIPKIAIKVSSFARRVGINVISSVIKLKTGVKIFDTTSGFRAINRTVLEIFSNDYPREYPEPISTVNILCNGLNVSEVGVSMNERIGGVSSIKSWKTAYYMINVVLSILLMKGKKTNGK